MSFWPEALIMSFVVNLQAKKTCMVHSKSKERGDEEMT
jgi:hypothetical protein